MAIGSQPHDILALDVGAARIGVARASSVVRLAEPLTTITHNEQVEAVIQKLCNEHNVEVLVVGLPRGLEGQETAQTATIREFVDRLTAVVNIPIVFQDEAVTSQKAEQELQARNKPYEKGDVDALAATYILEDYLGGHGTLVEQS